MALGYLAQQGPRKGSGCWVQGSAGPRTLHAGACWRQALLGLLWFGGLRQSLALTGAVPVGSPQLLPLLRAHSTSSTRACLPSTAPGVHAAREDAGLCQALCAPPTPCAAPHMGRIVSKDQASRPTLGKKICFVKGERWRNNSDTSCEVWDENY